VRGIGAEHAEQIAILTHRRGPWELRRYPLPDPGPGAILVRVSYANVCGSDLHIWHGDTDSTGLPASLK